MTVALSNSFQNQFGFGIETSVATCILARTGVYRDVCFAMCVEPSLDGFHNCSGVTSAYRAHDCLDGWNRRAENEEWKSGNNDVNPIISELVENILPSNSVVVEPINWVIHSDNPGRAIISVSQMIPYAFCYLRVSPALVFSNESKNVVPKKRICKQEDNATSELCVVLLYPPPPPPPHLVP